MRTPGSGCKKAVLDGTEKLKTGCANPVDPAEVGGATA